MTAEGPNTGGFPPPQPPGRGEREADACSATTLDGRPCGARPQAGRGVCYAHDTDPGVAIERAAARRKGGLVATSTKYLDAATTSAPSLDSPEEIKGLLSQTILQVVTGQLSVPAGNAVAYIVSTAIRLEELRLHTAVAAMEAELARRKR